MTRTYTLGKRAVQQAETRRRIVEAAVDLHTAVGPASTTVSMIAERAGVQRHTFYAHFPDERSLLMACSGMATERDPPPDAEPWRAIADPGARLAVGLDALYAWYERNAQLTACILRDAEVHALTREVTALRMGPAFAAYAVVLGEGLDGAGVAMLRVALSFHSWRTLVQEGGLSRPAAVAAMVRAVAGPCSDAADTDLRAATGDTDL